MRLEIQSNIVEMNIQSDSFSLTRQRWDMIKMGAQGALSHCSFKMKRIGENKELLAAREYSFFNGRHVPCRECQPLTPAPVPQRRFIRINDPIVWRP